MHNLHSKNPNFCNLIIAIFINSEHAWFAFLNFEFLQFNSCNFLLNRQRNISCSHGNSTPRPHQTDNMEHGLRPLSHPSILVFDYKSENYEIKMTFYWRFLLDFQLKWYCQSQATRRGKSKILKTSNLLLRSCYRVWTCHRTQKFDQTLLCLLKIKDLKLQGRILNLALDEQFFAFSAKKRSNDKDTWPCWWKYK